MRGPCKNSLGPARPHVFSYPSLNLTMSKASRSNGCLCNPLLDTCSVTDQSWRIWRCQSPNDTVHPRDRLLQRRARLLFSRYVLAGMARCCIAGPQIPLCPGTCPGFSRLTEFGCQKAAPTRSMHFPSDLASVHTITAHIRAEIHDAPLLLPAQSILRRVTG